MRPKAKAVLVRCSWNLRVVGHLVLRISLKRGFQCFRTLNPFTGKAIEFCPPPGGILAQRKSRCSGEDQAFRSSIKLRRSRQPTAAARAGLMFHVEHWLPFPAGVAWGAGPNCRRARAAATPFSKVPGRGSGPKNQPSQPKKGTRLVPFFFEKAWRCAMVTPQLRAGRQRTEPP
jgi:hypothetical protein